MSAQTRLRNKRKLERTLLNGRWFHPDAKHGTITGYIAFSCRCQPCSDEEQKRRRPHLTNGAWSPADSLAVDAWARTFLNKPPLQRDPKLYELLHSPKKAA